MLILVRHASPLVDPEADPATWELQPHGHELAGKLAPLLPPGALLVSSAEPKARQTIEPAGTVVTDARFNEVVRDEAFGEDFRTARAAYVGGADHDRWEPRAQVATRFQAAIDEWLASAGDRALVVASHGMAMTLWLDSVADLGDVPQFWRALTFPDALIVDPAAGTVCRLDGLVYAS